MESLPSATSHLPNDSQAEVSVYSARKDAMVQLLTHWADCYLAIALALVGLLGYLRAGLPPVVILVPVAGLDGLLIYWSLQALKRPSAPHTYEAVARSQHLLEALEHICTLLSKVLLSATLLWPIFPPIASALPLAVHLVFRLLYREAALSDCQAFSGMVRTTQFRLIWRVTRLCLVVTMSLKYSGLVSWKWASVFWPAWLTLSMLGLISLGVLLLALGSLCALCTGEVRLKEVACAIWFLYVAGGSCAVAMGVLVLIARSLDGSDFEELLVLSVGAGAAYCSSVALWTRAMRKTLGDWWDTFFNALDSTEPVIPSPRALVAHTRKITRQLITVGQATPRLLVRVSSNYFRPASRPPKPRAATRFFVSPIVVPEGPEDDPQMTNRNLISSKQRSESMEPQAPRISESSQSSDGSRQCVICCEFPANAVVMQCGHGGLCLACATAMWKRAEMCHFCRRKIDNIVHVQPTSKTTVSVVSVTYTKSDCPAGSSTIVSDNTQI